MPKVTIAEAAQATEHAEALNELGKCTFLTGKRLASDNFEAYSKFCSLQPMLFEKSLKMQSWPTVNVDRVFGNRVTVNRAGI